MKRKQSTFTTQYSYKNYNIEYGTHFPKGKQSRTLILNETRYVNTKIKRIKNR